MIKSTRGFRPGRTIIVVVVLAALAALLWLAVSLGRGDKSSFGGGARGRPSTTVGVATATRADIPITLDALGAVTPAATVTVTPQVAGVITEIRFREGQIVSRGQVLAVIDPRPLEMAVMQAEGTLARDQAQLANAKLLLARQRTLLAQDSIARQDVDTQAALVRQLEGVVTTDRAALGTARINLGHSRVVAPVSGRAGLRVVDVGNYVTSGMSGGLVVITEVAPIDVAFSVPQDRIPDIQAEAARRALPVTALDRTKSVVLEQGVFSTLDNQVDATTGTVRGKARFANAAGRLFPNQFVNVRIGLQTLRGVVVAPVTAVRTGADGDFVWKLNADHTVTLRKVTRGPGLPDKTSILQGLAPGEQVITEGGDRLTDGAHVRLPGDRPQGRGGLNGRGGSAAPNSGGAQNADGRAAIRQACAADLSARCPGKSGREAFGCLRENAESLAPSCRTALERMRRRAAGG